MMNNKEDIVQEEDEVVVADMSGITKKNLFSVKSATYTPQENSQPKTVQEDLLTSDERKWYILGALKASFLIGLAYAVGFGLFIFLILMLYKYR